MSPKETGVFIAALRKEIGITQQELAQKLQVTAKAVSRWETGKGYPDITILPEISNVFNVSVNEILNGKRCKKDETEEICEETILNAYHQAKKELKMKKLKFLTLLIGMVCITLNLWYTLNFIPVSFQVKYFLISAALPIISTLLMLSFPLLLIIQNHKRKTSKVLPIISIVVNSIIFIAAISLTLTAGMPNYLILNKLNLVNSYAAYLITFLGGGGLWFIIGFSLIIVGSILSLPKKN